MNNELKFLIVILRNAFILSGVYFVSVFATGDLTYEVCKPILVFFGGYIFVELARHYGLNVAQVPKKKVNTPLIFV